MPQHCWEMPGCDEEMSGRCPHQTLCPAECSFASCHRPTHVKAGLFEVLDFPDTDRNAARKEECRFCMFFLEHGPKVDPDAQPAAAPAPRTQAAPCSEPMFATLPEELTHE